MYLLPKLNQRELLVKRREPSPSAVCAYRYIRDNEPSVIRWPSQVLRPTWPCKAFSIARIWFRVALRFLFFGRGLSQGATCS